MATPIIRIKPVFIAAILIGLTTSAMAQLGQESDQTLASPLEPLRSGVTEGQIVAELLAHNELRKTALAVYFCTVVFRSNRSEISLALRSPSRSTCLN